MNIKNIEEIHIFDEFGWPEHLFSPHSLLKTMISHNFINIKDVIFYNTDRMLYLRSVYGQDYYFNGLGLDILEHLCKITELNYSLRTYCLANKYFNCTPEKYPLLNAIVFG